jgi:hypothetical protein
LCLCVFAKMHAEITCMHIHMCTTLMLHVCMDNCRTEKRDIGSTEAAMLYSSTNGSFVR